MLGLSTEILFEKFEVLEVLKKDEHAAVFLANHIYLSKRIILKVLNTQKISDQSLVERFKREAKLLAKLDHPNIIKVLDFGTHKEFFYISFEYIEGMSLRNLLKTKQLTHEQKENMMVQLLKALDFAHNNNIIHRDIKPENIFINLNLGLKLGDFGLALSSEDNFVTNPYSIVGTPSYMSPEQVRGVKLTPQSDLFSAGVVLFELFTGVNPFLKENVNLTLNEIMSYNESALSEKLEPLQPDVKDVLHRLLRKNVSNRYPSAKEVLKDLNVPEDQPTVSLNNIHNNGSNKKKILFAASAVLVIVTALTLIFMNGNAEKNKGQNIANVPAEKNINQQTDKGNDAGNTSATENKNDEPVRQENVNDANQQLQLGDGKDDVENNHAQTPAAVKYGGLFVECFPWAEIYIDGEKVETTPMTKPLTLTEGEHTIKLVNQDYPLYTKVVNIKQGDISRIRVLLDSLMAYINCRVFPWGDVYINEDYKGQTPLRGLVKVVPGFIKLTIKNPNFKTIDTLLNAAKGDTLNLRFTFKK
ncbi:MAG: serine/threonine protein kinase [Ignavibacteriales bacterium]|nr:serine/threonine protein kinase [Ignavibacteriales bacterium]